MLRGVPDGEIATLLRVETGEVERRRDQALQRLGESLGTRSTDEVERLFLPPEAPDTPAELLNGAGAHRNGAARSPWVSVARRRPSPRALALVMAGLAALVAVTVAVVSLLGAGDPTGPPPPAPKLSAGPVVKLAPVAGATGANGNIRVQDSRLVLRVRDLPPTKGEYTLWLYDSVADGVPLARFRLRSAKVTAPLPSDAVRYRFADISVEPRDGNPNHSGASILRAPLAPLR